MFQNVIGIIERIKLSLQEFMVLFDWKSIPKISHLNIGSTSLYWSSRLDHAQLDWWFF
jgi:hypothetical protein